MERRQFLKALIGCAAGVAGAAALSGNAEAMPITAPPTGADQPKVKAEPAITSEAEVDGMKAEPVWHRRWHRRRRRVYIYRRPRRYWRRRRRVIIL